MCDLGKHDMTMYTVLSKTLCGVYTGTAVATVYIRTFT